MCRSGKMKDIDASFAPFCYRGGVRKLVHEFKFEGDSSFIHYLGWQMAESLPERDFDGIVPVPLSRERMWDRGVNQARLLAEALSVRVNIPVMDALERTGDRKPQSATPIDKREENVKGVFRSVRTSGSTAQECAKELKKAGAVKVGLCTLAVVYRDPKKFKPMKPLTRGQKILRFLSRFPYV